MGHVTVTFSQPINTVVYFLGTPLTLPIWMSYVDGSLFEGIQVDRLRDSLARFGTLTTIFNLIEVYLYTWP